MVIGKETTHSVSQERRRPKRALYFPKSCVMITVKKKKLIIELRHSDPEEFSKDLQAALFTGLRVIHADAARDVPALDGQELCDAATPLLELLQAISDKQE
jgi:hypothetical protein